MTSFLGVVPRLPANDLLRTAAFYTDALGFALGGLWPDTSNPKFIVLHRDDVTVEFFSVHTGADDEAAQLPAAELGDAVLTIAVAPFDAMLEAVSEETRLEWGPEVESDGRSRFAIRDPNGYQIVFVESDADSG